MRLCGKQSMNGLPLTLVTSENKTIKEYLDELSKMAYAITSIEHEQKYGKEKTK